MSALPFVGADHEGALAGDGHVHARHGRIGAQEVLAHALPRGMGQVGGVAGAGLGTDLLVEQLADLLLLQVDGGHHDVRRRLFAQLQNALAEVGLDALDTLLFQVGDQVHLLGQHGLGLDQLLLAPLLENAGDDLVVLPRIPRPVHLHAVGLAVARELPQQLGKMRQHVQLHPAGGFPHLLPFREGLGLEVALVPQRQQGRGMPVDPGLVGGEGLDLAGVGLTHGLPPSESLD